MNRAIEYLADELGLDRGYIVRARRIGSAVFEANRCHHPQLSLPACLRAVTADRYAETCIAVTAMHLAGRPDDATLLLNIHRAMKTAPNALVSVGALKEDLRDRRVRDAIHILRAAALPPLRMNGDTVISHGFQVVASTPEMPGWIFVGPDPDAENRTGVAGGRDGYARVLRWANWLTAPDEEGNDVIGALHPHDARRETH